MRRSPHTGRGLQLYTHTPTTLRVKGQGDDAFTDITKASDCPCEEDLTFHLAPSSPDFPQLSLLASLFLCAVQTAGQGAAARLLPVRVAASGLWGPIGSCCQRESKAALPEPLQLPAQTPAGRATAAKEADREGAVVAELK